MPIILGPWFSILARVWMDAKNALKSHEADSEILDVIIGDGDVISTMLLASEPYDIPLWIDMLSPVHQNLESLLDKYPSDNDIKSAWNYVDQVLSEMQEKK